MKSSIADRRLLNQRIATRGLRTPAEVVARLGAVQAQEYEPARWALGLRMRSTTFADDVEHAFARGEILRTHVLRPTWHFVTPADIRWMLELTAPRVHRAMSSYTRRLGLDSDTLVRGTAVFERSLRGNQYLTRGELGDRLQEAGVPLRGVALALLTMYAELEGVICSGPRRGKQFTYALVAERAPKALRLSRDEALAELSKRYFASHGPATIRDFVWWSGLTTADAKRGLAMNRARSEEANGRTYWTIRPTSRATARADLVHLLPIYDEYLVAYRDRDAVPHAPSSIVSSKEASVTFQHALVIAGHVAGTWRLSRTAAGLVVNAFPMRRLRKIERDALADAAGRYGRFVQRAADLSIA